MWRFAGLLTATIATTACTLAQDFDRYSAHHGQTQSEASDATVLEDTSMGPADTALEDTGTVDTALPDVTTPPIDSTGCGSGQASCGGSCVDVLSSRDHCGGCNSCEAQGYKGAARCVSGVCLCRSGATKCGDTCTYVDSDPLHCKACNAKIADRTVVCGGSCAPPLRKCVDWSYGDCPGVTCVDTQSEGNHCYEYTATSTKFVRCWSANEGDCIGGKCTKIGCTGVGRKSCAARFGPPEDSTVRSCVDTLHDPNHCGGCDAACAVGELCAEGVCRAYHPARSPDDCPTSQTYYTPQGWTKSVCLDK